MTNREYIMAQWETLPISRFDELEVVIVKCNHHSEEGYGHHSYAGFGCTRDGRWVYCYSSGCSCRGGPDHEYLSDTTTPKGLYVHDDDTIETLNALPLLTPKEFENLQVSFSNYE